MIWGFLTAVVLMATIAYAVLEFRKTKSLIQEVAAPISLFVIQNLKSLNTDTISNMLERLSTTHGEISFEAPLRKDGNALVMGAARWLAAQFPELKVLEIEEYLPDTESSNLKGINLRFSDSPPHQLPENFSKRIKEVPLLGPEQIFFQALIKVPPKPFMGLTDVCFRIIIYSEDETRRNALSQEIGSLVSQNSTLVAIDKTTQIEDFVSVYKTRAYLVAENVGDRISVQDLEKMLI